MNYYIDLHEHIERIMRSAGLQLSSLMASIVFILFAQMKR